MILQAISVSSKKYGHRGQAESNVADVLVAYARESKQDYCSDRARADIVVQLL